MIIHYNCTIGSILLHSFLLICHPYPSSFHEMIFIPSAVVVNDHNYVSLSLPISFLNVSMTLLGQKRYRHRDTYYDHSLQLHYIIGSILLHSFLLIYHPYPPSFLLIFILDYLWGVQSMISKIRACEAYRVLEWV